VQPIVLSNTGQPSLSGVALREGASINVYQSGAMVPCTIMQDSRTGHLYAMNTRNGERIELTRGLWAEWPGSASAYPNKGGR